MPTAALRRSGGSLIVTIPQAYAEQNRLEAGSLVFIEINGDELKLKPGRQRPKPGGTAGGHATWALSRRRLG